jgi:hypothetical protein
MAQEEWVYVYPRDVDGERDVLALSVTVPEILSPQDGELAFVNFRGQLTESLRQAERIFTVDVWIVDTIHATESPFCTFLRCFPFSDHDDGSRDIQFELYVYNDSKPDSEENQDDCEHSDAWVESTAYVDAMSLVCHAFLSNDRGEQYRGKKIELDAVPSRWLVGKIVRGQYQSHYFRLEVFDRAYSSHPDYAAWQTFEVCGSLFTHVDSPATASSVLDHVLALREGEENEGGSGLPDSLHFRVTCPAALQSLGVALRQNTGHRMA